MIVHYHIRIVSYNLTFLKIPCALLIHPSLPLSPWQPLIFTVSVLLPFPESHSAGIVQFVALSDWLLSLTSVHGSFLHIFSWLNSSFVFSAE